MEMTVADQQAVERLRESKASDLEGEAKLAGIIKEGTQQYYD
jgi:hypothetical protein